MNTFGTVFQKYPIRRINFKRDLDRVAHDTVVAQVERLIKLHETLALAKAPDTQDRLQREIASIDRSIDLLVYRLYGLVDEEIRLVESVTAAASGRITK